MTESMPPTLGQALRLNRILTEKVLNKAASDPQWKQQLLDDPEEAMRTADFPETQQLQRIREQAAEVRGHVFLGSDLSSGSDPSWGGGWCRYWTWRCYWWTWRWDQG
jgi:hypothetical protein